MRKKKLSVDFLCFFQVLDEPLQCPVQSKRADWGAGYETFAQNFVRFEGLGCSPLKTNLPVDKLRLEQLLKEKEAKIISTTPNCREQRNEITMNLLNPTKPVE